MQLPKKTQPVRSYQTLFQTKEAPLSEGGLWLNGRKDGIDWADVLVKNGRAYGEVTRMTAREKRVEQSGLGAGAAAGASPACLILGSRAARR